MAKKKTAPAAPAPVVNHNECGIRLDNVNPVLPPDNEHTNSGTVALAGAVVRMAEAITETAKALHEIARNTERSGVYIGHCQIGDVTTGLRFGRPK